MSTTIDSTRREFQPQNRVEDSRPRQPLQETETARALRGLLTSPQMNRLKSVLRANMEALKVIPLAEVENRKVYKVRIRENYVEIKATAGRLVPGASEREINQFAKKLLNPDIAEIRGIARSVSLTREQRRALNQRVAANTNGQRTAGNGNSNVQHTNRGNLAGNTIGQVASGARVLENNGNPGEGAVAQVNNNIGDVAEDAEVMSSNVVQGCDGNQNKAGSTVFLSNNKMGNVGKGAKVLSGHVVRCGENFGSQNEFEDIGPGAMIGVSLGRRSNS